MACAMTAPLPKEPFGCALSKGYEGASPFIAASPSREGKGRGDGPPWEYVAERGSRCGGNNPQSASRTAPLPKEPFGCALSKGGEGAQPLHSSFPFPRREGARGWAAMGICCRTGQPLRREQSSVRFADSPFAKGAFWVCALERRPNTKPVGVHHAQTPPF